MNPFARLALISLVATMSACADTSPYFSRGFGNEARTLWAQQTRDPEATQKHKDKKPDGIDGKAARQTLERYQKSFGDPPRPANAFTIGIGSGGESGGSK
jgi:hypothetical protein